MQERCGISVIVPVLNDAECLQALLARLAAEPGSLEIIVVDGGSRDGISQLVRRFSRVRLLYSPPGRGAQMNAGARAARGDVLLFLHSDTLPPRGAVAELPSLLQANGADFGAFRIRFNPPFHTLRFLALFTRLAEPWTCFGDQGIFTRRRFFWTTGGFPEIPLLEDVHWLRRAGRKGSMTRSPRTVVSSARRFRKVGVLRQHGRNLTILLRDLLGHDPAELAKIYSRSGGQEQVADAASAPVADPREVAAPSFLPMQRS